MLDLPKMRERAEEPNEFRNNLHLVGFEYTCNVTTTDQFESDSAEGCGESVLHAEGALGGEVLEEQRLCHGDVVQAVRGLA